MQRLTLRPGLRLYSAAPGILERVVDAEPHGFTLLGHTLPAGTIVGTQAWSMHRAAAHFRAPDTFCPERWLSKDDSRSGLPSNDSSTADSSYSESKLKMHADAHMMPWGLGTRVCTGMTLAQIVLRLVVVAVVRNFEVRAPGETTEGSMEMRDSFVSILAIVFQLSPSESDQSFRAAAGDVPGCDEVSACL
ncbi:hypothetical protein EVG20_g2381 [Dentipellis fragilis]|uniref:Cytochrome P450 n=1 Tax=Dentipellis fragilis TaxID=205917 RepID=A0A4Y9Z864_9AGAM|nr:hypothetical protein EVG20_g2381 [Dentipellis fragilis]